MGIAVIAHIMHREYLLKTFLLHPDFNHRIVCFVDWGEDFEDE